MKKSVIIILTVVIAAVVLAGLFFYLRQNGSLLNTGTTDDPADVEKVVTDLGKVMVLPTDETPSVATVLDKEKLSDQPFFAKAQNGDKMIIYTGAKKAILFRPSENKIVEVMPLLIGDTDASAANTVPSTDSQVPTATNAIGGQMMEED